MNILKVRIYGDPTLRQKSLAIKDVGSSERLLIQSMIATMHEQKGVGLAAPQVGINQRVFVADIGEGPMVFINPKIIKKSGSETLEEGCLSIPGINVPVKRATKLVVRYFDENNREFEGVFENLWARIIQHETDHLDGKLIIDYADRELKKAVKEQLEQLEKQSQD